MDVFAKFVAFDLETTGLDKEKDQIIEIGAVIMDENYLVLGEFKTLVKPQYNETISKKYETLTNEKIKDTARVGGFGYTREVLASAT